jgi:ABC-type thiamine transport system ATPase subunit
VLPDEGSIKVAGEDITHLPPEKRATAMMFQSYALWPHMTGRGEHRLWASHAGLEARCHRPARRRTC